eukprot:gene19650-26336_t
MQNHKAAIECRAYRLGTGDVGERVKVNVLLQASNRPAMHITGYKDDIDELMDHSNAECVLVVDGLLGQGSFGKVWRVYEASTRRRYALKRILKESIMDCANSAFEEQTITRNIADAFCVRQHASLQDDAYIYFLFEYMEHGDLMNVLCSHATRSVTYCFTQMRGIPELSTKFYIACVVMAMRYLHDNDLVHRDLKPKNVFIDSMGYARLVDFGLAKRLKKGEKTFTVCGTPSYIAPEVIIGNGYTQTCDCFSVGVLAYVLLTGMSPHCTSPDDDAMIVMRRIVDPTFRVYLPGFVSKDAKDFVRGLLKTSPIDRFGCSHMRWENVVKHKWFDGFDWDALRSRKLKPPFVPEKHVLFSDTRRSMEVVTPNIVLEIFKAF